MAQYPRRADHFREWSKLMLEQAIVPDRVQYKFKQTSGKKSYKGRKKRGFRVKRRKRFLRRKRQHRE